MTESAPSSDQDARLLDKLLSIDFSLAEKDRIGRALANGGSLQARALASKAPTIRDPEFWGRAQTKLRVNGFRPGAPDAMRKVVDRALAAARAHSTGESDADWPSIWPLYKRSVQAYFDDERPALVRLLKKERFRAGPGSPTDPIFRVIVKCLPLYEVTVAHVRELYELWGFERTDLIEEILSDVSVRPDAVRRMIDDGVSALQREFQKSHAVEKDERQRQIREQAGELASVRAALKEIRRDLADVLSEPRTAAVPVQVASRSSPLSIGQTTVRAVAMAAQPTNSQETQRSQLTLEAVQARVDSLGKQLKDLRRCVEQQARDERSITALPTRRLIHTVVAASQVLERWRAALVATGAPDTLATARSMLELVRRSRVLLTKEPRLLASLFTSLPAGEARVIAASPLWLSEADWKEDIAFLAQEGGGPRLLVIENFDAALQEAYLVPPLLAWLSSVPATCANRVALVPWGDGLKDVSPRILEIATCFAHTAPYLDWPHVDEQTVAPLPAQGQSGVELLNFEPSTSLASESDLSRYLRNQGVLVPSRLARNFVRLYDGLRSVLSPREARAIAQNATLIPWAEHVCAATHAAMLRKALEAIDEP